MKLNFRQKLGLCALILLVVSLAGCATNWVSEASNIINLLVPAIQAALAILAAFGIAKGLSPDVMAAVNKWANEATNSLTNVVKPLIEEYSSAVDSAKPGILEEIKAALDVTVKELGLILPTIHVNDPETQAKIMAVVQAIELEMTALLNLVPAVQGKVTEHHELKALMHALKSPKEFREDFNHKAGEFGEEYKI